MSRSSSDGRATAISGVIQFRASLTTMLRRKWVSQYCHLCSSQQLCALITGTYLLTAKQTARSKCPSDYGSIKAASKKFTPAQFVPTAQTRSESFIQRTIWSRRIFLQDVRFTQYPCCFHISRLLCPSPQSVNCSMIGRPDTALGHIIRQLVATTIQVQ